MASIESLPPDQRAVLQLVLQRGRSYDDIAGLLSIERIAVRQRAHAALDALGPGTRLDPDQRAQITDYLLGQQTDAEAAQTRERLASSAGERAWARVVASELAPLAGGKLPEIPAEGIPQEMPPPAVPSEPAVAPTDAPAVPAESPARAEPRAGRRERRLRPEPEPEPATAFGASGDPEDGDRPVSRRGGALLIGIAAVVVIVVIVVVIASGGSSSNNTTSTTNANAGSTTAPATTPTGSTASTGTTGSTGSTGTTGASTQVLARFNLTSPTSKTAVGIAELLRANSQLGIAVVGEHIPANTKTNAYAVWLYNSPGHAELLGFVNPGVTSSEQLSTAGPLPANASQYRQLLVTIETQSKPKQPGTIVLEGQVKLTTS
jgi:Sigma-70, region 4